MNTAPTPCQNPVAPPASRSVQSRSRHGRACVYGSCWLRRCWSPVLWPWVGNAGKSRRLRSCRWNRLRRLAAPQTAALQCHRQPKRQHLRHCQQLLPLLHLHLHLHLRLRLYCPFSRKHRPLHHRPRHRRRVRSRPQARPQRPSRRHPIPMRPPQSRPSPMHCRRCRRRYVPHCPPSRSAGLRTLPTANTAC